MAVSELPSDVIERVHPDPRFLHDSAFLHDDGLWCEFKKQLVLTLSLEFDYDIELKSKKRGIIQTEIGRRCKPSHR